MRVGVAGAGVVGGVGAGVVGVDGAGVVACVPRAGERGSSLDDRVYIRRRICLVLPQASSLDRSYC